MKHHLNTENFNVFSGDLYRKLRFTMLILILYRLGSIITIPGVDIDRLQLFFGKNNSGFFGTLNVFTGGAFHQMAIFALNIAPYVLASIVVQISSSVVPKFIALKKEGMMGRRILNMYTKKLTLPIGIAQSCVISVGLRNSSFGTDQWWFVPVSIAVLVTGVMILVWIGEQITQHGINQGSSVLIFAGIVSSLPQAILGMIKFGIQDWYSAAIVLVVICFILLMCIVVIYVECAEIRLPIWHARGEAGLARFQSVNDTYLPLKINIAGVVPTMFANSILSMVTGFSKLGSDLNPVLRWFSNNLPQDSLLYMMLYVFILAFASFFYSFVVIDINETSDNLRKNGSFFPNIRPGIATQQYLTNTMNAIVIMGIVYSSMVCVVPMLISTMFNAKLAGFFPANIGTSCIMIILVARSLFLTIFSSSLTQKYQNIASKAQNIFIDKNFI